MNAKTSTKEAGSSAPEFSAMPVASSGTARISVALCTYNGARFLGEQLESFVLQTRRPDELVVCDDGSTDETPVLLRRFAERAPFSVRVEHNLERLGSTKNFEKSIRLCTGDLIATADQDDVWLPEKLALSEAPFLRDPRCGLVFTDAEVVDEALQPIGHRMWEAIHFGRWLRRRVRLGKGFETLLRQWLVTGATMVFRADYRRVVLPIPENWIHDGWISFIIGALAPLAMVERPTMRYRQHEAQQIGGKKLGLKDLYAKAREVGPTHFRLAYERFQLAEERLLTCAGELRDPRFLSMLSGKIAHQKRRLEISETPSRWKRIAWTFGELVRGGYSRYSPTVSHFIKDMFF